MCAAASRVCGITPSSAATTGTAISVAVAPRRRIAKSGVSRAVKKSQRPMSFAQLGRVRRRRAIPPDHRRHGRLAQRRRARLPDRRVPSPRPRRDVAPRVRDRARSRGYVVDGVPARRVPSHPSAPRLAAARGRAIPGRSTQNCLSNRELPSPKTFANSTRVDPSGRSAGACSRLQAERLNDLFSPASSTGARAPCLYRRPRFFCTLKLSLRRAPLLTILVALHARSSISFPCNQTATSSSSPAPTTRLRPPSAPATRS